MVCSCLLEDVDTGCEEENVRSACVHGLEQEVVDAEANRESRGCDDVKGNRKRGIDMFRESL